MENVQEIYALTPVQSGMLFHALAEPGSGVYVVQVHCEIRGPLEASSLRAAWDSAVSRHPVLRTAFVWEGLDEPLQAVRTDVDLPWSELDWQGHSDERQAALLSELLAEERNLGFDLARAPLLRLKLIRLAPERVRLVWTVHHLVVDGWSTVVLLEEVFTAVRGSSGEAGPSVSVPSAPPFRRFVDWLATRDSAADSDFWKRALAGHEGPAPLAVAPRSSRSGGRTARLTVTLGQEETQALEAFARQNRLTLATVVHGAWALLLARYGEGRSVTYGAVMSGRPSVLPGVDRMVGPLLTTVPVVVPADLDLEALTPWLSEFQNSLGQLRSFEHAPPTEIAALRPSGTPRTLFDSVLVFENSPQGNFGVADGSDLEIRDLVYVDQSNYDLALLVMPGADLHFSALYRDERLDEESVRVLLSHLLSVLKSFWQHPAQPLRRHMPPQATERARIETEMQASDYGCLLPDLAEVDVVERFSEWATTHPEQLALVSGGRGWTYSELDRRSAAVARELVAGPDNGARPPVALLGGRSPHLLAGILGILRSGAGYVPLDPSYPQARLEFMVSDSGAGHLLVTPDQRDHPLVQSGIRVTVMDWDIHDMSERAPIEPAPDPNDLAYVVYTSGSTGPPKGVGVTRGNLAYSTWARGPVYQEDPDRFLLVSPVVFDSSKVGIFWPLTTGGAVVLPADGEERDPAALLGLIRCHEVTHVLCLPTIHEWILAGAEQEQVTSLRTVIVAGESCPPGLVERHHRTLPGVRLFNEYGPTETTVWASVHECVPGDSPDPVPIGRPIPGAHIRVLDRHGEPAPIRVPGEIHIGGSGVSAGYLGDPKETAARFTNRSQRSYRSGDLGRFREDGLLEFLGRVDRQVKIRGHRVELSEVEASLERHPGVLEAAVTVTGGGASSVQDEIARLIAWVAPRAEAPLDPVGLRSAVAAELPAHMMPDRIVLIPELPRGPTGKIDRAALREREPTPPAPSQIVAPSTESEERLAEMWAAVLGLSAVGVEDNFFEIGGHSLLAVRLLGKIREGFSVELPMDAVFDNPTVRSLAARLEAGWETDRETDRETDPAELDREEFEF